MRTTDPIDFVSDHRDTIFRCLGILAALLVAFLILRHLAMRMGGWRVAWARVKRECAITAHAFAAPFRAWLRHRRSLRVLVRGLRAQATWHDAERALAAARQAAAPSGGHPYAALVSADTVTVLLAGGTAGPPENGPWWADEDHGPGHWVVERAELPPVVPVAERPHPVLVALGEAEGRCAFLDLATGPPLLSVEGDRRGRVALHQAVAAQLDARLPENLVVVAEGVHRAFPGMPVRAAYRSARDLKPEHGVAPVLVTAELPDPLPPEIATPEGTRIVLLGPGRGYLRTLLTDRHGQVAVAGTPLLVAGNALSRAVARVLSSLPPVLPPAPPDAAHSFTELEEDEHSAALSQFAEDGEQAAAPTVPVPAPVAPSAPAPPVAEDETEAEDESGREAAPAAPPPGDAAAAAGDGAGRSAGRAPVSVSSTRSETDH